MDYIDDNKPSKIGDRVIAALIAALFGFLLGRVIGHFVYLFFELGFGLEWISAAFICGFWFFYSEQVQKFVVPYLVEHIGVALPIHRYTKVLQANALVAA